MSYDCIVNELKNTLIPFLSESVSINSEDIELSLTGSHFSLSGEELYEFLLCVEDRFKVIFQYYEIKDGNFKSIK